MPKDPSTRYDPKVRADAIEMVLSGKASTTEVAAMIGTNRNTVQHWMRSAGYYSPRRGHGAQWLKRAPQHPPGDTHLPAVRASDIIELEQEVARLQGEIKTYADLMLHAEEMLRTKAGENQRLRQDYAAIEQRCRVLEAEVEPLRRDAQLWHEELVRRKRREINETEKLAKERRAALERTLQQLAADKRGGRH